MQHVVSCFSNPPKCVICPQSPSSASSTNMIMIMYCCEESVVKMRMMLCFKFGQDCERAQDCDWTKQCISWLWNDDNWRKQACPGADCILTNHQLWSKSLILAHPTSHAHKCSNAFWCSNMEVIFYKDLKFNDFSIALDELYFMFISLDITQIWQILPTLNLGEWVVRESEVTCVNLEWERRASRKKGGGGTLKPLKAWLQS